MSGIVGTFARDRMIMVPGGADRLAATRWPNGRGGLLPQYSEPDRGPGIGRAPVISWW